MSQILQNIFHEYDPVASQLPFLGSPIPLIALTLGYLLVVLLIGPAFMKNRRPFNIKNVILIYNFLQIIANSWLCYLTVSMFYAKRADVPDFGCLTKFEHSPALQSHNVYGMYAFYMLKLSDYIETVFFVLRKSFKQVSFLHVYHHIMMGFTVYYLGTYYGAAGHYCSILALNCAVHGFMYTYYLVSALQPNMKLGLWWKKYITILQLVQFVLVIIHHSYPLLFRTKCDFPNGMLWYAVCQSIIMLWLFGNFYRRTYLRVNQKAKTNTSDEKSVKSD